MIKKRGRTKLPESGTLVAPSSTLLENHFEELLEAIEEIRGLTALLKALPASSEKRDDYEGRLYAALTHLDHHVKPANKEWDRVVDQMADK
ncbi:MAG: hypothetical protein E8D48_13985 [Nitrospira sp.]|nr:MAG: hypothetical protein E8D48_13985 [Nitrospira sp.]